MREKSCRKRAQFRPTSINLTTLKSDSYGDREDDYHTKNYGGNNDQKGANNETTFLYNLLFFFLSTYNKENHKKRRKQTQTDNNKLTVNFLFRFNVETLRRKKS